MKNNSQRKFIITGVILGVIVLTLIGAYSLWTYSNTLGNQILIAGDIYMKYTGTNNISAINAVPSDTYNNKDFFEFTIEGKNTYSKDIVYDIVLNHGADPEDENRTERISDDLLKFRLVKVTGEDLEEEVVPEITYNNLTNKKIWVERILANTTEETSTKYRLYMWIGNDLKIGNTDEATYDMDTWNDNVFASIKVTVNGDFENKKADGETEPLIDIIRTKINNSNSVTDEEDGTIYLSGTNDQINFNYVWYSGKLWRITAINPNNTIKMVTQDEITAIPWDKDYSITYDNSYVYQWLNEDFLNTLENYETIIEENVNWNATLTSSTNKPKNTTLVTGTVGMLNTYEYVQSYKKLGVYDDKNAYSEAYLNIGYTWWLITPYSGSGTWYIRYVDSDGKLNQNRAAINSSYGVRPSVVLKSNIQILTEEDIEGNPRGSKENPYRIEGDKVIAKVNDKLNSRVSGEYVNFDEKKYRIVGIENETTKLNSVDYVRNKKGYVIRKLFGNYKYGSTITDNWWSGFLNDTTLSSEDVEGGWYGSINETYKNMLVKGTYYLGRVSDNYKTSICLEDTIDPIKICQKTSEVWVGYIGLPRTGEMFSAQLADKQNGDSTTAIWLLTPDHYNEVSVIGDAGYIVQIAPYDEQAARPSITLNSNVYITEGEGTEQSPYEIKCDNCSS